MSIAVDLTTYITCSLSIIGALFILVSFLLFGEFRQVPSRQLLFFLSLCDFLIAVAYLIQHDPQTGSEPTTACKVQSAINIFSNQASFLWTDSIAAYVFICCKYGLKKANRFVPFFHIISWGLPLISMTAVIISGFWGSDNNHSTASWCWIKGDGTRREEIVWHLLAGKLVEWSSFIILTILYICVYWDIHSKVAQSPGAQLLINQKRQSTWKTTEKKLLAIPAVFVVMRIVGTVRTIYSFTGDTDPDSFMNSTIMMSLQAFGDSGQGFANGILFGVFTDKVIKNYKILFWRLASRFNGNPYLEGEEEEEEEYTQRPSA